MPPSIDMPLPAPGPRADFVTLTKPRLNLLVLFTTLGGLYLASPEGVATSLLVHTLLGTALVAGAQRRSIKWGTQDGSPDAPHERPTLPQGRLGVNEGTWFGVLLTSIGLIELTFGANSTAAVVAFAVGQLRGGLRRSRREPRSPPWSVPSPVRCRR